MPILCAPSRTLSTLPRSSSSASRICRTRPVPPLRHRACPRPPYCMRCMRPPPPLQPVSECKSGGYGWPPSLEEATLRTSPPRRADGLPGDNGGGGGLLRIFRRKPGSPPGEAPEEEVEELPGGPGGGGPGGGGRGGMFGFVRTPFDRPGDRVRVEGNPYAPDIHHDPLEEARARGYGASLMVGHPEGEVRRHLQLASCPTCRSQVGSGSPRKSSCK
jgi:hypothetical protein